jgi:hypothetical protein
VQDAKHKVLRTVINDSPRGIPILTTYFRNICNKVISQSRFFKWLCEKNVLNAQITFLCFLCFVDLYLDAILGNDPLDALFLNVFILCLYMFRAVLIIRRSKFY